MLSHAAEACMHTYCTTHTCILTVRHTYAYLQYDTYMHTYCTTQTYHAGAMLQHVHNTTKVTDITLTNIGYQTDNGAGYVRVVHRFLS